MGLRWASLLFVLAAGCSEKKYFWVCTRSAIVLAGGPEDKVEAMLTARGVDFIYGPGDLACNPLCVSGPRGSLFRIRELVQAIEADRVSWPADTLVPFDTADQLGWEKGPWTKVAGVRHRVISTERVLDCLEAEGMATTFYFGETTDLVFVKPPDAARAAELLRGAAIPGVESVR